MDVADLDAANTRLRTVREVALDGITCFSDVALERTGPAG